MPDRTRIPAESPVAMVAHRLVVTLINLEMHDPRGQLVQDSARRTTEQIVTAIDRDPTASITIAVRDGCLYHGDELLLGSTLQAARLIALCSERSIDGLRFGAQTTPHELLAFLHLLCDEGKRDALHPARAATLLQAAGIEHITVLAESADAPRLDSQTSDTVSKYQALSGCLQESHVAASRGHDLEIEKACGIIESALSKVNAPAGLLALASHHFIDSFTVGHSVRVALLALQVAAAGGASRENLIRIGTAALLHDIGKSRIPQEVLFKQGRLTDEEREIMARHPRLGGEVLLEQPNLDPGAIGAAFCHHMSPAGGYPQPTLAFEPSPVSKLVRVCDVFEALTAVRPYKKALTPLEAYAVMFRDERDFDQAWLRFFVQAMGIYPQGTFLSLDTGEVALVVGPGTSPTQPLVQLMTDAQGRPYPDGARDTVQLGECVDGITRDVAADLPGPDAVWGGAQTAAPVHHSTHDPASHDHGVQGCCGEQLVDPPPRA